MKKLVLMRLEVDSRRRTVGVRSQPLPCLPPPPCDTLSVSKHLARRGNLISFLKKDLVKPMQAKGSSLSSPHILTRGSSRQFPHFSLSVPRRPGPSAHDAEDEDDEEGSGEGFGRRAQHGAEPIMWLYKMKTMRRDQRREAESAHCRPTNVWMQSSGRVDAGASQWTSVRKRWAYHMTPPRPRR